MTPPSVQLAATIVSRPTGLVLAARLATIRRGHYQPFWQFRTVFSHRSAIALVGGETPGREWSGDAGTCH